MTQAWTRRRFLAGMMSAAALIPLGVTTPVLRPDLRAHITTTAEEYTQRRREQQARDRNLVWLPNLEWPHLQRVAEALGKAGLGAVILTHEGASWNDKLQLDTPDPQPVLREIVKIFNGEGVPVHGWWGLALSAPDPAVEMLNALTVMHSGVHGVFVDIDYAPVPRGSDSIEIIRGRHVRKFNMYMDWIARGAESLPWWTWVTRQPFRMWRPWAISGFGAILDNRLFLGGPGSNPPFGPGAFANRGDEWAVMMPVTAPVVGDRWSIHDTPFPEDGDDIDMEWIVDALDAVLLAPLRQPHLVAVPFDTDNERRRYRVSVAMREFAEYAEGHSRSPVSVVLNAYGSGSLLSWDTEQYIVDRVASPEPIVISGRPLILPDSIRPICPVSEEETEGGEAADEIPAPDSADSTAP